MLGLIIYLNDRLRALFVVVYGSVPSKPLAVAEAPPPVDPKQQRSSGGGDDDGGFRAKFCCKNCRDSLSLTVPLVSGAQNSQSNHQADPSWVSFFANWKNGSTTSADDNKSTRKKRVRKGAAGDDGPMADRIATRAQRLLVGAENATAAYKEVYVDQWHPTDNPQGNINLCTAENNLCDDLLHEKFESNSDRLRPNEARISHYPVPGGYESTKEAAVRYLEHFHSASHLRTDFMILTPGCTAAYDMLSYVLCEPGDVVLSAAPFYGRLFNNFEERGQAEVVPVSYRNIMSPQLDIEPFETMKWRLEEEGKRVKVIVVINPNNPLGVVFPKDQVIRLCNWATSNKIHVIIDEVFASSVYEHSNQFQSFLSYRNHVDTTNVSYLWSFSKDLCLPGLKFSLVYTESEHLIKSLRRLEIMQPCAPCVQHIAEVLLDDLDWLKNFHAEKNARLQKNKNFLCAMLNKLRIDYVPCTAAFTVYVDLRRYMVDASFKGELQLWLELCGAGVFISPGQFMGGSEVGWFRIVFSGDRNALIEGLHRFEEALGKLSSKVSNIPALPRIDTNPLLVDYSTLGQQAPVETHPEEPEPTMKRELSGWDFGSCRSSPETSASLNRKKRVSWVDVEGVAQTLENAKARDDSPIIEESDPDYLQRVRKVSETRRGSIDVILDNQEEEMEESRERKVTIAEVQKYDHSYIDQFIRKTSVVRGEIKEGILKYQPAMDAREEGPVVKPTIVVSDFDASYIADLISEKPQSEESDRKQTDAGILDHVFAAQSDPKTPVISKEDVSSKQVMKYERKPSPPVIDTSFVADLVAQKPTETRTERQEDISLDDVIVKKTKDEVGSTEIDAQSSEKKPELLHNLDLETKKARPTIDTSFVAELIAPKTQDDAKKCESNIRMDDFFAKSVSPEIKSSSVHTEEHHEPGSLHNVDLDTEDVKATIDTSFVAAMLARSSPHCGKTLPVGSPGIKSEAVKPKVKGVHELDLEIQDIKPTIDTSFVADLIAQAPKDQIKESDSNVSMDEVFTSARTEAPAGSKAKPETQKTDSKEDHKSATLHNVDIDTEKAKSTIDTSFIAGLIDQKPGDQAAKTQSDLMNTVFESNPSVERVMAEKTDISEKVSSVSNEHHHAESHHATRVQHNVDLDTEQVKPTIDTSFVAAMLAQEPRDEVKESKSDISLEDVFVEPSVGIGSPKSEQILPSVSPRIKPEVVKPKVKGVHELDLEIQDIKPTIDTSFVADLIAQAPKDQIKESLDEVLTGARTEGPVIKPETQKTDSKEDRKSARKEDSVSNDHHHAESHHATRVQHNVDLDTETAKPTIDTSFVAAMLAQGPKDKVKESKSDISLEDVFAEPSAGSGSPKSEKTLPVRKVVSPGIKSEVEKPKVKGVHELDLEIQDIKPTIDTSFVADLIAQKSTEESKNAPDNLLDSVFPSSVHLEGEQRVQTTKEEHPKATSSSCLPEVRHLDLEIEKPKSTIDTSFVGALIAQKPEEHADNILAGVFTTPLPESTQQVKLADLPEPVATSSPKKQRKIEMVDVSSVTYIDRVESKEERQIDSEHKDVDGQSGQSPIDSSFISEPEQPEFEVTVSDAPEKPARTFTETELASIRDRPQDPKASIHSIGADPTVTEPLKRSDAAVESIFDQPIVDTVTVEEKNYDEASTASIYHDQVQAGIDTSFVADLVAQDTVTDAVKDTESDILSSVFEGSKPTRKITLHEVQEFDSLYVERFIANNPTVRRKSVPESPILLRKSNLVEDTVVPSKRHATKRLVHQDSVQIIRKKHQLRPEEDDNLLSAVFPHRESDSAESSDGEFRRLTLVHSYRPGLEEKLVSEAEIIEPKSEKSRKSSKKVSISAMKPTRIAATVTHDDSDELVSSASPKDVDLAEAPEERGRKVTREEVEAFDSTYIEKFIVEKHSFAECSLKLESSGLIDTSFIQDMFKEYPEAQKQAVMKTSDDLMVKIFGAVPGEVCKQISVQNEEDGEVDLHVPEVDAAHHAVPLREELNFIDNLVRASRRSHSFEEDTDIIDKVFSGLNSLKRVPNEPETTFTVTEPFDVGEEVFEDPKFHIDGDITIVPEPVSPGLMPETTKKPRKLSKIASASDISKKEKDLLSAEMAARHQSMTSEDDDLMYSVFKPSYSTQQSQVDEESADFVENEHEKYQGQDDADSLNDADGAQTPLPSRVDDLQFEVPEETLLEAVFREQRKISRSEAHDARTTEEKHWEQRDRTTEEQVAGTQTPLPSDADDVRLETPQDAVARAENEELVADETFSSTSTLDRPESASSESTVHEMPRIDVSFVEELVRHQNPHVLSPGTLSMDSGIVAPKKCIAFDQSASSSESSFRKDSSDSDSSVIRISSDRRKPSKSLTNLAKFDDASSESSSIRPNSPLNRACEEYENLLTHVFQGSTAPPDEDEASKVKKLHYREDGFQQSAPESAKPKPVERKLTITTRVSEDSLRDVDHEEETPHHDGFQHHAVPLEQQFGFIDELVRETKESRSFEEDHDIIEKVFTGMSSLKRREIKDDCAKERKIEPQFTLSISRKLPEETRSRKLVEIDPNDGLLDLVFSESQKMKKKVKKRHSEGEVVVKKIDVTQIVYDSKSLPDREVERPEPEPNQGQGSFIQSLLLNSLLITLPDNIASMETIERVSSDPIYPFRGSHDEDPCPTRNHIYYHIVPNKEDPSEFELETIPVPKRLHLIQQQQASHCEDTVDSTTQTTHVLIEIETKDEAIQESAEQKEIGIQTAKHVGFHCQITVIPPEDQHAGLRYPVEAECQNSKHKKDSDHCQPQYRIKQSSMTPSEKILGKTDKLFMTKDKSLGQWVISAVCRSTPYGFERSSLAAKGYAPAPLLPDVIDSTRK